MLRRPSALAAVAVTLGVALAACGDDEQAEPATTSAGEAGGVASGAPGVCADVDAPEPRADGDETAPDGTLDVARTWTLTFDTSCGSFTVTLDPQLAPATTASIVALADDGFFDDTVFHRIVPGFVIQGGDPTQTGSGGPGYSTADPPPEGAAYVRGVVAMAKAGTEPAGTAGSQFFVVTAADVGLPADYAIIGAVTDGLDVVEQIGALGDPATERPLQAVVVSSVTVDSNP